MPQTVPLKEGHVDTAREALDTGDQVALGPPAQTSIEAINGLADAVQLTVAVVDADDTTHAFLEKVDSDIATVTPPADAATAVVLLAQRALIHLLRNGRIP